MRWPSVFDFMARVLRVGSYTDVDQRADQRDIRYRMLQKELELYRRRTKETQQRRESD